MEVFRSLDTYIPGTRSVATIGTFDGLHIGHQALFNRMQESAEEVEGETVLISFNPHPRLVLFPENNPLRLLQSLDEKIEMLERMGVDKVLFIPFTKEFSRLSSKAFIQEVLVDIVKIHHVVIGYDHHFGKNRTGSIEELQALSEKYGYGVEQIEALSVDSSNVSSTKIRRALEEGEIKLANAFLGYNYPLRGKVIHGEKAGRSLGYPTANIEPDEPRKLIPKEGVYVVKAHVEADSTPRSGLMSIGTKPTLGDFAPAYEVHLLDFEGDLYGQVLKVEFLDFLRPQVKFKDLDELVAAMQADEAHARRILEG